MRIVSERAIVMRPLLAALASLSLFSQLCMSGCAVGPSYRRPATTLEDFHSVGAHAADPTRAPAPALEAWWDDFNDPMLSRIVQRARDQNLDLAAALARVQQARAAAREAGAQLLPTVDLDGQATRIHQSLESPTGQIASQLPGYRPKSVHLRCRPRCGLGARSIRRAASRQRGRVGRSGRRPRRAGRRPDFRYRGCGGYVPAHPRRSGSYRGCRAAGRYR